MVIVFRLVSVLVLFMLVGRLSMLLFLMLLGIMLLISVFSEL